MTDDGSISMKLYRIMVGVELALSVCLVVTEYVCDQGFHVPQSVIELSVPLHSQQFSFQ